MHSTNPLLDFSTPYPSGSISTATDYDFHIIMIIIIISHPSPSVPRILFVISDFAVLLLSIFTREPRKDNSF